MTTILVVEDEVFICLAICDGLAAENFEVLTAADADQAIRILETRNDISAIFTDINLPNSIDGLKLAASVRDRWPDIRIVITSGKTRPSLDELPKNSAFVQKPYQTSDVINALRALA